MMTWRRRWINIQRHHDLAARRHTGGALCCIYGINLSTKCVTMLMCHHIYEHLAVNRGPRGRLASNPHLSKPRLRPLLILLRQLTPRPQLRAEFHEHEGDETQRCAEQRQYQASILTPMKRKKVSKGPYRHLSRGRSTYPTFSKNCVAKSGVTAPSVFRMRP